MVQHKSPLANGRAMAGEDEHAPPLLALLQASLPPGGSVTPTEEQEAGPAGLHRTASPSQATLEALQGLSGSAAAEQAPSSQAAADAVGLLQRKGSPKLRAAALGSGGGSGGAGAKDRKRSWFFGMFGSGSGGGKGGAAPEEAAAAPNPAQQPNGRSASSSSHAAAARSPGSGGVNAVVLPGLHVVAAAANRSASHSRTSSSSHSVPESPRLAAHPLSIAGSDVPSAPSTAAPSPAVPSLPLAGLPPGDQPSVTSGGKPAKHKRSHSLTAFLKMGRRHNKGSVGSEAELGDPGTPQEQLPNSASAAASRLPTPHGTPGGVEAPGLAAAGKASPTSGAASAMSCFGAYGPRPAGALDTVRSEEAVPVVPPVLTQGAAAADEVVVGGSGNIIPSLAAGAVPPGIRNIGNTCFVNAALQCLRSTPGLPLALVPDLLRKVERELYEQQLTPKASATSEAGALEAQAEAAEDVHGQALARASVDMTEAAFEAARQALRAVSDSPPASPGSAAATDQVAHGSSTAAAAAAGEAPAASPAAPTSEQQQEQPSQAGTAAEVADSQQQQEETSPPAPAQLSKPSRPPRGALLEVFGQMVERLYLADGSQPLDPVPLLRTLRAFPIAADYFDGGQHDCQEVLRVMMDLLHQDLNRVPPPGSLTPSLAAASSSSGSAAAEGGAGSPEQQQEGPASQLANGIGQQLQQQQRTDEQTAEGRRASQQEEDEEDQPDEKRTESEHERADRFWRSYLKRDSSLITDLFGGQLQSSVTCHRCGGRFTMYEPFWDLSLPLAKEAKGGSLSWLGLSKGSPATIQDCLGLFTADEKLEGQEAFSCEVCQEKTPATKHLRLHRLPEALVLHIKRFKLRGSTMEKLPANVSYPLTDLRLHSFVSPESGLSEADCVYDLYAVSNHYGNLSGGHYTAMCCLAEAGGGQAWYSFNDEHVTRVKPELVVSQYAYILFYMRRPRGSASSGGKAQHTLAPQAAQQQPQQQGRSSARHSRNPSKQEGDEHA